jgi:hypothetical protein
MGRAINLVSGLPGPGINVPTKADIPVPSTFAPEDPVEAK